MKKLLCIILAILLILTIAGCTGGSQEKPSASSEKVTQASQAETTKAAAETTKKKEVTIAFANLKDSIEFCQSVKKGIEDEAKKKGWKIFSMDNDFDGAKSVANANNVVALNADLFLEFNSDSKAGESIMEIMNKAKIPVIAIDIPLPGVPYFGADNFGAGKVGGVTAAEIAKKEWGKCDYVVVITRADGGELIKQREDGFFEGVKTIFPDIDAKKQIVIDGKGDVLPAKQVFTDFLTAHPDAKNIIVGPVNDQCAQGAISAAETSGREGNVLMISQGCDKSAIDNLYLDKQNAWRGSVSYAPEMYGSYLIPLAEKILNGEKIPDKNYLKHFTITKENVEKYYPKK